MTMLGVYAGEPTAANFRAWLGHPADMVDKHADWWDWDAGIVASIQQFGLDNAAAPEATNWTVPFMLLDGKGTTMLEASQGLYDGRYTDAARAVLAAHNRPDGPIYVRTGHEFNFGFPWRVTDAVTGAQFIGAFRRFASAFRAVSDRFKLVWCTNVDGADPMLGWPGAEYVDVIGLDIYFNAEYGTDGLGWLGYMRGKPFGLDWLVQFGAEQGRPIAIPEFGFKCSTGASLGRGKIAPEQSPQPELVTAFAQWARGNDVLWMSLWDSNDAIDCQFSSGQYPITGAAFKAAFPEEEVHVPTTYYVNPSSGLDTNDGTETKPLKTLGKANALAASGDEIIAAAGVYGPEVVWVKTGVTYTGLAGAAIDLGGTADYAFAGKDKNGFTVSGFEIKNAKMAGMSFTSCHTFDVMGNNVHDCAGNGISIQRSERYFVESNEVSNCARTGASSGISCLFDMAISGDDTPGPRNFILRNHCHHNSGVGTAPLSDGNGIIVDRKDGASDDRPNDGPAVDYRFETIVEGNLCHDNGGSGIRLTWSRNCTVRQNTVVGNMQDERKTSTWKAELSEQWAVGNTFTDNIAVSTRADTAAFGNYLDATQGDGGNTLTGNFLFNTALATKLTHGTSGSQRPSPTTNFLGLDPMLRDIAAGDFRLQPTSPAVGSASGRANAGYDQDTKAPVTPPAEPEEPTVPDTPTPATPLDPRDPVHRRAIALAYAIAAATRKDAPDAEALVTTAKRLASYMADGN